MYLTKKEYLFVLRISSNILWGIVPWKHLGDSFTQNVVTIYKHLKGIFKPDVLWHFCKGGKEDTYKKEGGCINK